MLKNSTCQKWRKKQMSKQNKKTFSQKINSYSWDVTKHFKKLIIASAVLLIAAFVLLFTIGFNKSVEFTGGTAVRVYKQEQTTIETMQSKIDKVLFDNGLEASVYQEVEFEGNKFISVKYKNDVNLSETRLNEVNEKIVDELFIEFDFDKNDLEQEGYVVGNERFDSSVGRQAMLNTFLIIVVASVFVVAYFAIRFKHQTAMTALLSIYHDVLLAISLTLIFRVEINLTFMSGLLFVLGFSMLNNLLYFSNVKDKIKQAEKSVTAKDIAISALKQYIKTEISISSIAIVALGVFMAFGLTTVFSVGMISIFGVIASFYSVTFLVPTLWKAVYIPSKKKTKAKLEAKESE
jgi:preprotein translocase SecF subunit